MTILGKPMVIFSVVIEVILMTILVAILVVIPMVILAVLHTISPLGALFKFDLEEVFMAADPACLNSTAMSSQILTPKGYLPRSITSSKRVMVAEIRVVIVVVIKEETVIGGDLRQH